MNDKSTTVETTATGIEYTETDTLITDKMSSRTTEMINNNNIINNQTQLSKNDGDDGVELRKLNELTDNFQINSTSDKNLLLNINSDNNSLININSNSINNNNNNNLNYKQKENRFNIKVRTTPGRVSYLTVRASTIIAVLIWEVFTNRTGGYALKSFTAEYRLYTLNNYLYENDIINNYYLINYTTKWERLDPSNISPNAVSWFFLFFYLVINLFMY